MTTPNTIQKNTSACYLQAAASFGVALAKCVRDAQEDEMVVRRLDQARLDRALASHDPFKNAG